MKVGLKPWFMLVCMVIAPRVCQGMDYCKIETCPKFKRHVMCEYPTDTVACAGDGVETGLSEALKKRIVELHNSYRSKVARGLVYKQLASSNMMALTWHEEAARLAQRWADQCALGKDDCRNLESDEVGQSVAQKDMQLDNPNVTATVEKILNEWFLEADGEQADFVNNQVKSFTTETNSVGRIVGHYTQLVWAKTTAVGCGFIALRPENKYFKSTHLVCNYVPGGNVVGQPIYKTGKAGSACPKQSQCSKTHLGLCTRHDSDFGSCPGSKSGQSAVKPSLLTIYLIPFCYNAFSFLN